MPIRFIRFGLDWPNLAVCMAQSDTYAIGECFFTPPAGRDWAEDKIGLWVLVCNFGTSLLTIREVGSLFFGFAMDMATREMRERQYFIPTIGKDVLLRAMNPIMPVRNSQANSTQSMLGARVY